MNWQRQAVTMATLGIQNGRISYLVIEDVAARTATDETTNAAAE